MSGLDHLGSHRWPVNPGPASHRALSSVLVSRVWTGGRYTAAVETAMCELTGARYAVAFQSCTAAIHAALLAHGARRGSPLHTPAFGFAGTLTGASHIGARLIYHDVHEDTGNSVDPLAAPGQLVLTPDLHGVPHTLPREDVITDACQSLGTLVGGKHVGARGTHCWSFSATKLISAPDGGAVTTDDGALFEELQQLRDYGADLSGHSRANALITRPGHNWRPSELSMALVTEQLHKVDRVAERARETGTRVLQTLIECGLWHQAVPPGVEPAFHKIRTGMRTSVSTGRRSGLLRLALADAGIPTHDWGVHPLPDHPVFPHDELSTSPLPVAFGIADGTFCLGTETCPPWTWTSYETSLVCHTIELIMEKLS